MLYSIGVLATFFTLAMGGASFAASFAAAYGSKVISKRMAVVLFIVFVTLGASLYGQQVTTTLGQKIIPADLISDKILAIIFLTAGLSMFVANLMKIPQSTSLVTVATIAGVGLYLQQMNVKTILYLVPFWIILPVISFVLTYGLASFVYPPRKENFWIYEKFVNQKSRLRKFVIICSCYNAFSVGTNNVANVAGPIAGAGIMDTFLALILFGFVYGAGAQLFAGPLTTAGAKIVPLGLLTASIISLVSGSLMIFASGLGIPQSFVMLQVAAIFAIGSLKHGRYFTFFDPIAQKTLFTWTINPIITLFMSYGLCLLILGK